jgi:hypothetical protein
MNCRWKQQGGERPKKLATGGNGVWLYAVAVPDRTTRAVDRAHHTYHTGRRRYTKIHTVHTHAPLLLIDEAAA